MYDTEVTVIAPRTTAPRGPRASRVLRWLAIASLFTLAVASAACGSSPPASRHTGDRIINPNRISAGEHVRILEVGEGDKQFDESQSFKGMICTVGEGGISSGWTDGYYEGLLESCSNGGRSYRFEYVRVEPITKT